MKKNQIQWDPEALKRINKAPFFIRKFAKSKVEKAALALGESTISVELMEKIKQENMGR